MPAPTSSGSEPFNEKASGSGDVTTSGPRRSTPGGKRVHIELPAGIIWMDGTAVGKILASTRPGGTEIEIRLSTERVFEVLQSVADMDGFCRTDRVTEPPREITDPAQT